MKIILDEVKNILKSQNYLEYDKIYSEMLKACKTGEIIEIIDKNNKIITTLHNMEEMEYYHKKLIQVHGIYGYF
jgi:NurA-like 5'-3' nuclease